MVGGSWYTLYGSYPVISLLFLSPDFDSRLPIHELALNNNESQYKG